MGERNRWRRNRIGDREPPSWAGKWGHFLVFSLVREGDPVRVLQAPLP